MSFGRIGIASVAVAAAWLIGAAPAHASSPTNIVLIMAEDLSPRIGAYGDGVAHTPRIDALAAEGVRFTRAFTTAGVCAPSRAAIVMGAHQNRWGAGHMRAKRGGYVAVPPPEWKAFPELLRAAGYYTVNLGKTDYQMGTGFGGAAGGPFTIWDDASEGDWSSRAPDQPFFAYLNLGHTHESQVWPTWRIASLYQLLMAPMRIRNHRSWEHRTDPAAVSVPAYYPDTPTVRADIARHYDNIANADREVGKILDRLAAEGISDRTLVVFMGDHGDGLPRAKRWLYDSGILVPLIVRWPDGRDAGAVNEELVSGVDLAPTFLALAGVPRPAHLDGRVFLGDGAEPEPPYVFAARDRMDDQPDAVRAVRDRRFKYVRNLRPELPYVLDIAFRDQMPMMREMKKLAREGALAPGPARWFRATRDAEELYDTRDDPEEMRNLATDPEYAEERARLSGALDAWLASFEDLGLLPEEELRERFWPGGEEPQTPAPGVAFDGQRRLTLTAPVPGASLGYRIQKGPWQLYRGPVALPTEASVEARAVRYGWGASEAVARRAP